MNIGIEIEDENLGKKVDFSDIEKGNPGIGGTEYVLLLLAYELAKEGSHNIRVYHKNADIYYPEEVNASMISDDLHELVVDKIDIYIITTSKKSDEWYEFFDKNEINLVIHMDNYPQVERIKQFCRHDSIKRFVFLGGEEYDRYLDDDLIEKGVIIPNLHVPLPNWNRIYAKDKNNNVIYIGAIVPQKGVHILLKQWKSIIREVPDANLYVLGSGQLYNRNLTLGSYGIASETYEKQFISYITDNNGNILPSIHFCGLIDNVDEKYKIIKESKVGVVNPSGATEVLCGSAIEMEKLGVPVVTYAGNGQFDVVVDGKTGYLFKREDKLTEYVVKLLKDNKLNDEMGSEGINFTRKFETDNVLTDWLKLFEEIDAGKKPEYLGWHGSVFNNIKLVNIINRVLRIKLNLRFLPSRMCRVFGKKA